MKWSNEEKIEQLTELNIELNNIIDNGGSDIEIEKLNSSINEIEESLITVDQMLESFSENYNSTFKGQDGNGYYVAGSNTIYVDFAYGIDGETGEDIALRYVTDKGTLICGETELAFYS